MAKISYEKSKFINKNPNEILAKIPMSNGTEFFAIRYMPKDDKVVYEDEDIIIARIGTLNYKQLTACTDYITKYRVTKGNEVQEVYSTIIAEDMKKDKLYKQAVLDTLLGNENVQSSNCFGYVGTVSGNIGDVDSAYQINEKYFLTVNSVEATVVSEYIKMIEKMKSAEKSKQGDEPEGRDD